MSWAAKRRFIIIVILCVIAGAVLAGMLIATVSKTPSCSDGVQNQGEQGIDCGGPCSNLCTALEQPPTVLYTKLVPGLTGLVDVVASVENKNADAQAESVPYTVSFYDASHTLVHAETGTFDLPRGTTVPIFIANVGTGAAVPTTAFLSIDSARINWVRSTLSSVAPTVVGTRLLGATAAPRVEAQVANPTTVPLTNVHVIVLVHAIGDTIIAASATVVPTIPPQGQATAYFSWNRSFGILPQSIEVVPVPQLP